jgi:hypothetical protein
MVKKQAEEQGGIVAKLGQAASDDYFCWAARRFAFLTHTKGPSKWAFCLRYRVHMLLEMISADKLGINKIYQSRNRK